MVACLDADLGIAMPYALPAKRIIARFQHLCYFGPGGQVIIPDLLRELTRHVPSTISPAFVGLDTSYRTIGFYSDGGFAETIALYAAEFEERLERDVLWSASELFRRRRPAPVGDFHEQRLKVSMSEYRRSAFHNEIMRPYGCDKSLIVTLAGEGRHLATLCVERGVRDPEFTRREIRLLEAIEPFIVHALLQQPQAGPFVDSDDRALVIADENGVVRHASPEAKRLLLMVAPPAATGGRGARWLPEGVVGLCRRAAAWSETKPLPAPPILRVRNGWGEFVFRVWRMEQHAGLPTPRLLGIALERREPLRLKLLRRIGELPLSGRETELCLAVLEGRSGDEVADQLGIGKTTALTHWRSVYAKLDVHNRTELMEKLRAL